MHVLSAGAAVLALMGGVLPVAAPAAVADQGHVELPLCPARAPVTASFGPVATPHRDLPASPSALRLCGYSAGFPTKARPATGVDLSTRAAGTVVVLLDGAPMRPQPRRACPGAPLEVLLELGYRAGPPRDALVQMGCPSWGASWTPFTPALAWFGGRAHSVDANVSNMLLADATSYGLPRQPLTPDLVGDSAPVAARAAAAKGFTAGFGGEEVDGSLPPGTVLLQYPPVGMGDIGTGVEVIISAPVAPPCKAAQLALSFGGVQGATGNLVATLAVRNVSPSACELVGPLLVAGVDSSGQAVTSSVPYRVPPAAVLSPRARSLSSFGLAGPPLGEVYASFSVSSPSYCSGKTVQPTEWRVVAGGGALTVANRSDTAPRSQDAMRTCGRALRSFGLVSIG